MSRAPTPPDILLEPYHTTPLQMMKIVYTLILHTVYQIWDESSRHLSPVFPTPIPRIIRPLSQLTTRLQQNLLDFFKSILNSQLPRLQP